MKKEIEVFDYTNEIIKAVKTGVLVTTKVDDKVNSMTVSWGTIGIEWGKAIFTIFIRENRFTKHQLDKNPEFTVNIPIGTFDRKILGVCGTKSGHNTNKISELNLSLEEPKSISVPGIKELPLTLECKVIYKQKQDKNEIKEEILKDCYPQDVEGSFHGANRDFHTAYYGEIVSAYIIE